MAAENEYGQSKLYSFRNLQPVEVPEKMCDVVVLLHVTDLGPIGPIPS